MKTQGPNQRKTSDPTGRDDEDHPNFMGSEHFHLFVRFVLLLVQVNRFRSSQREGQCNVSRRRTPSFARSFFVVVALCVIVL